MLPEGVGRREGLGEKAGRAVRVGPTPKPVIAPPWVFLPHPLMTHLWLRCDMAVLEVDCKYEGCNAKVGEPCFYPANDHVGGRMTPDGMVKTAYARPAAYKGAAHYARTIAATDSRRGRAKIGVPVSIEVDMESGSVTVNAFVPNLARKKDQSNA